VTAPSPRPQSQRAQPPRLAALLKRRRVTARGRERRQTQQSVASPARLVLGVSPSAARALPCQGARAGASAPCRAGRHVPLLESFIQTVQAHRGTAAAKLARSVLSGLLGVAVRHRRHPGQPGPRPSPHPHRPAQGHPVADPRRVPGLARPARRRRRRPRQGPQTGPGDYRAAAAGSRTSSVGGLPISQWQRTSTTRTGSGTSPARRDRPSARRGAQDPCRPCPASLDCRGRRHRRTGCPVHQHSEV
jgi:hypothetical protein